MTGRERGLAWITSCRKSGCGLAHALVAGYLLDAPPRATSSEDLHDAAPDLSMMLNWGRIVPLDEPRPALARTELLPGTEVMQYYRAVTARVVYVSRDPRGIMSGMLRGRPVPAEELRRRARQLMAHPDEAAPHADDAHAPWQLHAREWTEPARVRAHFPYLRDICVIRQEDVATDPAAALTRILDFLEVPGKVGASGLLEMPPGINAFRTPPPRREGLRPEPSPDTGDLARALEEVYRERIREDAEFAALVERFGYAD